MEPRPTRRIFVEATDASGRQLRTSKSERTKKALLEAARGVFEELGYQDTRVVDITAAANSANGTFYRYFKSKEDIFRALAEGVRDSLLGAQQRTTIDDLAPEAILNADTMRSLIVQNMQAYLEDYRVEARLIKLLEEVAVYDPIVRDVLTDVSNRLTCNTFDALHIVSELGGRPIHDDPAITARFIRRLVDSVAQDWYLGGTDYDPETTVDALAEAWIRLSGLSYGAEVTSSATD